MKKILQTTITCAFNKKINKIINYYKNLKKNIYLLEKQNFKKKISKLINKSIFSSYLSLSPLKKNLNSNSV